MLRSKATTPRGILQIALAAWRQGNLAEVIDQFNDQFIFTDHALGLEFKDKKRLTEFLAKIRERFPDCERKVNAIFNSADRVGIAICEELDRSNDRGFKPDDFRRAYQAGTAGMILAPYIRATTRVGD